MNLFILLMLMLGIMFLPIHVNQVTLTLEKWITLTVFLQYGVLTELIFTQIAILLFIMTSRRSLSASFRFYINSSIFMLVSLTSAFVFHLFGGLLGSLDFLFILLTGALYALTHTVVNNFLLKVYFQSMNQSYSLLGREAVADYMLMLMMLPVALSFYFLGEHMGMYAIYLIGIPFLVIVFVIRTYVEENSLYRLVSSAGEIGHDLVDKLRFEEVLTAFLQKLRDIIAFHEGYIVDFTEDGRLQVLMSRIEGELKSSDESLIQDHEQIPSYLRKLKSVKRIGNKKELAKLTTFSFSKKVESVLFVPVQQNKETTGLLILTSTRRNYFHKTELLMIEVLVSYFAVSIENARFFEEKITESKRCSLTRLFNYRYLTKRMEEEFSKYNNGKIHSLSLIVVDIDYFKQVNDSYGHENGNEILIELAKVLQQFVTKEQIVARFGGEEFIFLLPNIEKKSAVNLAEKIRNTVENLQFHIVSDLKEQEALESISITCSLGVSTIPTDTTSVQTVLRNADRALYVGAKQAGRNKVGVFSPEL